MSGIRGIAAVAAMEFELALWSVRSLALGALFLLFVAAGAYLGIGAVVGVPGQGVPEQIAGELVLLAIVAMTAFFGPVIAIFSSVDSIVQERTTRTLDLLLSKPVTRRGLALGKLVGRAAHLALIAGSAIALGMVLIATRAAVPAGDALVLGLLVAVLCTIWAGIALVLSSLARTPTSAMVAGFAAWLVFYPFWGFVVGALEDLGLRGLPPFLNPNTLFLGTVQAALPGSMQTLGRLTEGLDVQAASLAFVLYMLVAGALAVLVFGWQDEAG